MYSQKVVVGNFWLDHGATPSWHLWDYLILFLAAHWERTLQRNTGFLSGVDLLWYLLLFRILHCQLFHNKWEWLFLIPRTGRIGTRLAVFKFSATTALHVSKTYSMGCCNNSKTRGSCNKFSRDFLKRPHYTELKMSATIPILGVFGHRPHWMQPSSIFLCEVHRADAWGYVLTGVRFWPMSVWNIQ